MILVEKNKEMEQSYDFVRKLSEEPEKLFENSEELSSSLKSNLKNLYDYCKVQEIRSTSSQSLPELIVQNFDDEQIWQQLELQNNCTLEQAIIRVGDILSRKENLKFDSHRDTEEESTNEDDIEDDAASVGDDIEDDTAETQSIEHDNLTSESSLDESDEDNEDQVLDNESIDRNKRSVVDDDFFKLHEMEEFLNSEEKKLNKDSGNEMESESESEESVDLFAEASEDSDDGAVRLAKYKEFFVKKDDEKKPKRNKFLEDLPSDEDVSQEEIPSTFESRQIRLQNKINEIEDETISEKPWQLQGEIKGDSRPQNSLLEEIVEFDRTSRPAPVITGQTTVLLEDIIKQRIRDKVFDSVERKEKPIETPLEYKKRLVLDQEKSKSSLAQVYEKEYLDQQAALNPENAEKEEEEPELHKEIKTMMKTLFKQLDALSNFHYTPKPAIPELKVISNVPAINMEEVAPVAASEAALLAPEEIKSKRKAEILGKSERTDTDKKRERRKKKLKQRYHAKQKEKRENMNEKLKPGSTKKLSKEKNKKMIEKVVKGDNVEKMIENLDKKGIKSSTAFFRTLQEQAKTEINTKRNSNKRKKDTVNNAKKIKL